MLYEISCFKPVFLSVHHLDINCVKFSRHHLWQLTLALWVSMLRKKCLTFVSEWVIY
jgi:hypothetical protein